MAYRQSQRSRTPLSHPAQRWPKLSRKWPDYAGIDGRGGLLELRPRRAGGCHADSTWTHTVGWDEVPPAL
jgi:hypothetical protein